MTAPATASDAPAPATPEAAGSPALPPLPLSQSQIRRHYTVLAIDGDDAIAARLLACGLWPGVQVERLTQAPFGDPLLFRLHGFRLALRASEAARVRVVEVA